jgi:hypothetical protein
VRLSTRLTASMITAAGDTALVGDAVRRDGAVERPSRGSRVWSAPAGSGTGSVGRAANGSTHMRRPGLRLRAPSATTRPLVGRTSVQTPCSKRVRWAREELNLHPLPCQIPRASADLFIGWLQIGKDHRKPAGERKSRCVYAPPIRDGSSTIFIDPLVVDCCPSAA